MTGNRDLANVSVRQIRRPRSEAEVPGQRLLVQIARFVLGDVSDLDSLLGLITHLNIGDFLAKLNRNFRRASRALKRRAVHRCSAGRRKARIAQDLSSGDGGGERVYRGLHLVEPAGPGKILKVDFLFLREERTRE